MRNDSFKKSAIAFGMALTAFSGTAAFAQTPPTAPPPAPGTTAPAPEQAPNGSATPGTPAPTTTPAAPATPPAAPNYNIQYGGLFDGYFMLQSHTPKDSSSITGRVYDVRNESPTLALAELNVYKNAKPGGLGFKSTFTAGDVADINHGGLGVGGKAEARYKAIQQLYGTYAFAGSAGGGVDFGKFYTPFGYEVTESNANYNYSRSLPYALLPVYHFGLRAYTPSYNGLVITGYLVSVLVNTPTTGVLDNNNQPAYIAQLNYTPASGKYTAIENIGGGTDKPAGVNTKTLISDTDFTYNITASSLVGLNYVYIKYDPSGSPSIKQSGYAGYYRMALTPKTAVALRYSGYTSQQAGTPDFKPYEVTATYEIKPASNFLTRFEYRHDHANAPIFLDSSSNATKSDQDTLTASGVFTF